MWRFVRPVPAFVLNGPKTFFRKMPPPPLTFAENISIIPYMIKKTRETAAYRRVASELKRLLTDGMVIEGTRG